MLPLARSQGTGAAPLTLRDQTWRALSSQLSWWRCLMRRCAVVDTVRQIGGEEQSGFYFPG